MEVQNYVGERPVKSVTVDVFPDSSPSTFVYYDDDSATYDCEKAGYFKQEIRASADATGSSLVLGPRMGEYSPALQLYTFKIHGLAGGSLTIDAKPARQLGALQELENSGDEGWATAADIYGAVTYVKVHAGFTCKIAIARGGS